MQFVIEEFEAFVIDSFESSDVRVQHANILFMGNDTKRRYLRLPIVSADKRSQIIED